MNEILLGTEKAGSQLEISASWPDMGPVNVIVPVADCSDVTEGRFTLMFR